MSGYKVVPVELTTEMMEEGLAGWNGNDLSETDLDDMWRRMLAAAPAVQGETVAIVCEFSDGNGPQPTFVEAEVGGKSVSFEWRDRPDGLKELLVPQSATPDVAGLVEALEIIEKGEDTGPDGWGAFRWADCRNIARAALAAYRKGGEV